MASDVQSSLRMPLHEKLEKKHACVLRVDNGNVPSLLPAQVLGSG